MSLFVSSAIRVFVAITCSKFADRDLKVPTAVPKSADVRIIIVSGITHWRLDSTSDHIFFILFVTLIGLKADVGNWSSVLSTLFMSVYTFSVSLIYESIEEDFSFVAITSKFSSKESIVRLFSKLEGDL